MPPDLCAVISMLRALFPLLHSFKFILLCIFILFIFALGVCVREPAHGRGGIGWLVVWSVHLMQKWTFGIRLRLDDWRTHTIFYLCFRFSVWKAAITRSIVVDDAIDATNYSYFLHTIYAKIVYFGCRCSCLRSTIYIRYVQRACTIFIYVHIVFVWSWQRPMNIYNIYVYPHTECAPECVQCSLFPRGLWHLIKFIARSGSVVGTCLSRWYIFSRVYLSRNAFIVARLIRIRMPYKFPAIDKIFK